MNVIVRGSASKNQYTDFIIKYCEPENLNIYVDKEDYNVSLEECVFTFQCNLYFLDYSKDVEFYKPNLIGIFTNDPTVSDIMLLNKCLTRVYIPVIFQNTDDFRQNEQNEENKNYGQS
jgi:hypothetical protein